MDYQLRSHQKISLDEIHSSNLFWSMFDAYLLDPYDSTQTFGSRFNGKIWTKIESEAEFSSHPLHRVFTDLLSNIHALDSEGRGLLSRMLVDHVKSPFFSLCIPVDDVQYRKTNDFCVLDKSQLLLYREDSDWYHCAVCGLNYPFLDRNSMKSIARSYLRSLREEAPSLCEGISLSDFLSVALKNGLR